MKRSVLLKKHQTWVVGLLSVGLLSFIGITVLHVSFADYPHYPDGFIDSCALIDGSTVIYGWAHDTDVPAGALPNVVLNISGSGVSITSKQPTNRPGYRDTPINGYLRYYYPGQPTSSIYGYVASLGKLYKDQSLTISGKIINQGLGEDRLLHVTNDHGIDFDKRKPFFANDRIPAACLSDRPPAPAPRPTPTPAPAPPTAPTPRPPAPKAPPIIPASLPSDANGTVHVGTLAVDITVPPSNATTTKILYGNSPDHLTSSSDEKTAASSGGTTFNLARLAASSSYNYVIVRTTGTQTTTSALQQFKTHGFTVRVQFLTAKRQAVSGMTATLSATKQKATTDTSGYVTLKDVAPGVQALQYTYHNRPHSQVLSIVASSASETDAVTSTIASLEYSFNVDNAVTATALKKSNYVLPLVVGLGSVICLIVATFVFTVLKRRRSLHPDIADYPQPNPPLSPQPTIVVPAPNIPPLPPFPPVSVPVDASHIGESLKEMVIESMRRETQNRQAQRGVNQTQDDGPDNTRIVSQ